MGGLISVSGSAEYDENKDTSALDEELCCNYHMETFSVRSLPSAKAAMDPLVTEKLLKGQIKATHVVNKIILGGEVNASILLKTRDTKSSQKIKGSFLGKLMLGPISATAKASLALLDTDVGHIFDKRIIVNAKPPIKTSPDSIGDMFKTIDNIYNNIVSEKHFPQITGATVFGVPLRFHLVPITQYLDVEVEMLYISIGDTILDEFKDMLATLKDLQVPEFLKKKILEKDDRIGLILSDLANKYTKEITEREVEMRKSASTYFLRATQTLKEYKIGKSTIEDISNLTKTFNAKFDLVQIYQIDIEEYVNAGKLLLVNAGIPDIEDKEKIQIFTNSTQLQDWFGGERGVKILLKTQNGGYVPGAFQLYEIGGELVKLDVKVGVAVPNISDDFSLTLKIKEKSFVYTGDELKFALKVISAFVNQGERTSMRFFKICANISGLHFTKNDYLVDLPSLISLLRKTYNFFEVTENYLQLLDLIMEDDDELKFVVTIETLFSAYDTIRKSIGFRDNFPPGKWILGNYEIEGEQDAPLIVFKNGQIVATIFDNLDFLAFSEISRIQGQSGLKIFDNSSKSFIHPDKFEFFNILSTRIRGKGQGRTNQTQKTIKYGRDDGVEAVLQIISAWLSCNKFDLLKVSLDILKLHHSEEFETSGAQILFDNSGKVYVSSENLQLWKNFLAALRNHANVFLVEIDAMLEILNEKLEEAKIDGLVKSIAMNTNCPNSLKQTLGSKTYFGQEEFKRHLVATKNELMTKSNKYYLTTVMQIVENYIDNEIRTVQSADIKIYGILNTLISKLAPKKFWEADWNERIKKDLGQNNFYSILNFLSPLRLHAKIAQIQNSIEDISNLNDVNGISKFLINLKQLGLDMEELRVIFSCPIFLHYLQYGVDDYTVLRNVRDLVCENKMIPNFIQPEMAIKLKEVLNPDEIILNSEFCSLTDAYKKFGQIIQANILPENFGEVLLISLAANPNFLLDMTSCGAIFYYNANKALFDQPWGIDTLKSAQVKIERQLEGIESEKHKIDYTELILDISLTSQEPRSTSGQNSARRAKEEVVTTKEFKGTTVKNLEALTMQKFVQIQAIIPKPEFDENVNVQMEHILPYMVQKIKMWGIYDIQPEHIQSFFRKVVVGLSESSSKPKSKLNFKGNRGQNQDALTAGVAKPRLTPLSRIDVLTYIASCCENVVLQDILKTISLFPVALPLVLNNLSPNDTHKYSFLQELLRVAAYKWETKTGIVQYHQLFRHKFKMILAIRIGSEDTKYSCGKSTILNQLLSTKNMFSSSSEPGATRGKSIFLDGTVEFVPLTQEICTTSFYEQCLKFHYDEDNNEIILLANLHGNATRYQLLIEELDPIVSSYLIFFNKQSVEELEENSTKFDSIVNLAEVFLVDPMEECKEVVEGENNIIDTGRLMEDQTLEKVRLAFIKCMNRRTKEANYEHKTETPRLTKTPHIETMASKGFIDYVNSKSCGFVKDKMSLQKPKFQKRKIVKELYNIWNNDAELRKIMSLFASCLFLPVDSRDKAMIHIDREISGLSSKETEKCRRDLLELKDAQSRIINLDDPGTAERERSNLLNKIKVKHNELDRMSLGMEHFYREIGRIYEISLLNQSHQANQNILKLPQRFAELLVRGHGLEILDGDLGDINEHWFSAVCNEVSKQFPGDANIFVVSILGLQSSGKSTLLNALFGCKFAVSTGRCTKGLFMRLLLLDEELRQKFGIDMILLIDTEGLGAPEKMNEPDNEQKDRLMATFAMSVSNLTLINVLGESIRDLTGILQIVIVTMARLEQAEISPDILMVQHLQERDKSKTLDGSKEFVAAIEEAIKITDTKNVTEVGIKNSKSLRNLIQRVQDGRILKQFRSFKNGATLNAPPSPQYHEDIVDLFETILTSCQGVENPLKLRTWVDLMPKYWQNIAAQNFALRFKNIKEISEFLHRGNKIANLKEIFSETLHYHKDECETKIRSELLVFERLAQNNSGDDWGKRKENLLKNVTEVILSIPYCLDGSDSSPCEKCINFQKVKEDLLKDVTGKEFEMDTKLTISSFEAEKKNSMKNQLKQFINAQEVKNGISSIFDNIVDNILREELKVKKCFTETERNKMIQRVWASLERSVSEKNNVAPVKRRILTEAQNVYGNGDLMKTIDDTGRVYNHSGQIYYLPDLSAISAYNYNFYRLDKHITGTKKNIDFQQKAKLEAELASVTDNILQESNSKFFEDGMVQKLHGKTKSIITTLKKNYNQEFLPEFIWSIHEYALKYFIIVMAKKELEWNRSHNPMTILAMKEQEFKKNIEIRLTYGFTFDGEGRIAGEKIMSALSFLGKKASNKSHRDYILGMTWMTNSGNVRLEYFKELAREVQSNNKSRALKHFEDPKSQILKWFVSKVNSFPEEEARNTYKKTVESEFEQMVQLVKNESDGFEIKKLIDKLLSKVDGVDYRTTLDFKAQKSDAQVYKESILGELEAKKRLLLEGHNWELESPSSHPEIMVRLGCTEHCYWCGSLCWGQFGHAKNTDGTNKHHTCHQPKGLIAECYVTGTSSWLIARKCDEANPDSLMAWSLTDPAARYAMGVAKDEKCMKWRDAMVHEDFRQWTFTAHPQNEFNEMTKWFFISLQNEIAKSKGVNTASQDELNQFGFQNLAIDSILMTISEKIGS